MKLRNMLIAGLFVLILFSTLLLQGAADKVNTDKSLGNSVKVVLLHHSTGDCIWKGGVVSWFKDYNKENKTKYKIYEKDFPKSPYGWKNYPYDYWNIWVKHAGNKTYQKEYTLEMLTKKYDVISFKHCFPVSAIKKSYVDADVSSERKTIENYKLQYNALKKKMLEFPDNRFVVWTGAALNKKSTTEEDAKRAKEFFDWVKNVWDEKDDNIFVWDFWQLETEGGLYLKDEYAAKKGDSHPSKDFSKKVAPFFCQRIIDVITDKADSTSLTGDAGSTASDLGKDAKIIFLHHSTGGCIWGGGVLQWFENYNKKNGSAYNISQVGYPKAKPYGWRNYPYDYWNIWVKNAGTEKFQDEETLEIMTQKYDVIIFKHCYPVSKVKPDTGNPDVSSATKSAENYKLQYNALKKKMKTFPQTRFIVWTGAALHSAATNEAEAKRAKNFFEWVKNDWDEKGDNIFVWDFWELETEGGLYLKDEYAPRPGNSHPDKEFSKTVAPYFSQRIIDVITGKGDSGSLTGK